jgi:hypothetical protein
MRGFAFVLSIIVVLNECAAPLCAQPMLAGEASSIIVSPSRSGGLVVGPPRGALIGPHTL